MRRSSRRQGSASLAPNERQPGVVDGTRLSTSRARSTAERGVVSHLRKRPADAGAWLLLAWLRLPSAPDEAAALARQAVRSDPADARVSDAARGLTGR